MSECSTESEHEYDLGLHIGAVFIIMGCSFLGTCLPIVGRRVSFLQVYIFFSVVLKLLGSRITLELCQDVWQWRYSSDRTCSYAYTRNRRFLKPMFTSFNSRRLLRLPHRNMSLCNFATSLYTTDGNEICGEKRKCKNPKRY